MSEKKYRDYLLTDLSRNPPHPEVISPIANFAGNEKWGENKFGIKLQEEVILLGNFEEESL